MNSKWSKDLNTSTKTIQALKENIRLYLHDLTLSKRFIDMTPKHEQPKNKLNSIKIQSYGSSFLKNCLFCKKGKLTEIKTEGEGEKEGWGEISFLCCFIP